MQDAIIYGTATFCNALVEGHLTIGTNSNEPYAFSNIPESNTNEVQGTLVVDNNLYVGGRIFCNGIDWSAMDSMLMQDAIIYGTATFCNALVEGVLTIGSSNNVQYAFSNIPDSNTNEIQGTLLIDDNLYVGGRIFCNGIQWSAVNSMELHDAIVYGTMTLCNGHVNGMVTFGNDGNYIAFSNVPNAVVNEVHGALIVDEDLYVGGRLFCNGFTMTATNLFDATVDTLTVTSNIALSYGHSNTKWMVQLDNEGADLVFRSINNTTMVITDDFASSVLNFTGQHLVSMKDFENKKLSDYIGKIVISTGQYNNLYNYASIDIDDAIPVVQLSYKARDKRVFGVISDVENTDNKRSYKIGNLQFVQDKEASDIKVKVNAVGEGGIWICNFRGKLRNGDLITTCPIPGYGAKQRHESLMTYTVAKITCDCDFDLKSKVYYCEEFEHNGKKFKKAFVGCIYKC